MPRTSDPALAERRRRQIAEAALACFRRRGFHQASMQEICAQAQISPGALYRYYPSKNHLIAAIAEEVQVGLVAGLAQAESGGDIAALLDVVGVVMLTEVFDPNDGALVAEVMAEAGRDPDLAARLSAVSAEMQERLASLIEAAQADGRLARTIAPNHPPPVIKAVIDGVGNRHTMDPAGRADEALAAYRAFLKAVFVFPDPPAPPPKSKRARTLMTAEDRSS